MKKDYQKIELVFILFDEDAVRTSQYDNVEELPDFPENFE